MYKRQGRNITYINLISLFSYTASKLVLIQTGRQRYTVDFSPVYGTLYENQLLRAQQNQEGDADIPFTVTVYLFMAKNATSLFILTWFLRTYVFLVAAKTRSNTYMHY